MTVEDTRGRIGGRRLAQSREAPTPDRLYVLSPNLPAEHARVLATRCMIRAVANAPKLSGRAALGIRPYWGEGFFGLVWDQSYLWYQETGIRAFTMRRLAGKTIPMWIDDPTGKERQEHPRAPVRYTASGKTQVLIFRRVARMGARKTVRRMVGGVPTDVNVPASYPGAPGRITRRQYDYDSGGTTGRIAPGNVGVRWRHPGLAQRSFLHRALELTANEAGLGTPEVQALYRSR